MEAPVCCGNCQRPNPRGSRRCAHCGRLIDQRGPRVPGTSIGCPLCTVPCDVAQLAGIEVDVCPRCRGIWFDDGELVQLPDKLNTAELADSAAECLATGSQAAPGEPRPAYLPCPVCGQHMRRHNYRQASGILVDRCNGCGTWVDRESVRRIFDLLSSPHLADVDRRAAETFMPTLPTSAPAAQAANEPMAVPSHERVLTGVVQVLLRILVSIDW
jgi:Zn-finger nucleic acid-binding protein